MNKNLIQQLREISETDSTNQGILAKYLLEYEGDLTKVRIKQICNEIFVSVSAATRLAQNLGLNGFNELKFTLQEEKNCLTREMGKISNPDLEVHCNEITDCLKQAFIKLDEQTIIECAKELDQHTKIDLYGIGMDNIIVQDFGLKLGRINKGVSYLSDPYLMKTRANHSEDSSLAMACVCQEESQQALGILNLAKKNGAKTILITSSEQEYDFDQVIRIEKNKQIGINSLIYTKMVVVSVLDYLFLRIIDQNKEKYTNLLKKDNLM